MPGAYFISLITMVALILPGCASKADVQPGAIRAVEKPIAAGVPEVVPHELPASCPVTVPQDTLFTAPEPYSPDSPFDSNFWYGSAALWTDLPKDGAWYGLPHNPTGYSQKIFWWREGYSWKEEPDPELIVTGERLDASAPPLIVSRATNAYAADIGSAMLVGVDFPAPGCWKITGKYAEAELSFIIWVAP